MKKHCEDGKILCEQFEDNLKLWGFAELNREAAERIIGGCVNPNLKELSQHAKDALCAFVLEIATSECHFLNGMSVHHGKHYCQFEVERVGKDKFAILCKSHPEA